MSARATLQRRLSTLDPSHRRILRGLLTVFAFVLLGKLAAAVREIAVAYRYGTSASVDVYVLAFTMASWLPVIWLGVLQIVYVPLINRLRASSRARFAAELHGASWIAAVLLSLGAAAALPWLLPAMAPGFDAAAIAELRRVGVELAPLTGLGLLVALYSCALLAEERHSNTLLEAVPAMVMLVAVLSWPTEGTLPLVAGVLLGTAAQAALLWWLLRRTGSAPGVAFGTGADGWQLFRDAMGYLVIAQVLFAFASPIDQYLAAGLEEGSVATLSYANRLLALAIGLGATAIGRAILPVLSDGAIGVAERFRLARRWFWLLLAAGTLAALLGYLLAPLLVRLIFEHGEFGAEDSRAVTRAVRYGLLQLPFYFSSIVLVQLFASLGRYGLIALSAVVPLLVKAGAGPWLVARLGLPGVLISTAAMYLINCVYFYAVAARGRRSPR